MNGDINYLLKKDWFKNKWTKRNRRLDNINKREKI